MMIALIPKPAGFRLALIGIMAVTLLVFSGMTQSLAAQTDPPSQEPKKQEPASQPAPAAPKPVEPFKLGAYEGRSEIEVGYRWVSDVAGNQDMYRSTVNLGEGPKLLRSNFSLRSNYGAGLLFDRMDLSFDSWGGDPYNTMRLSMSRADAYEFRADYRNLNYYNFIPTYANPLLGKESLLGQHSLNVTYRSTDLQLKLFPSRKVRPFVAFARNSGFGPGYTTYSVTGNEFLLKTDWRYASDEYRGGVELAFSKLALTVEQGYRFLRNDTSVVASGDTTGNNPRPFLGENITLAALNRGTHDRTTAPITNLLAKVYPHQSLKVTGRYVYSMSTLEGSLGEIDSGNFVSLENRLIFRSEADAFNTSAKQPNHNGAFLVEFTPHPRLTFLNQFDTRSRHVTGSALLAATYFGARSLLGPGGPAGDIKLNPLLNSYLSLDRVRNQAEVDIDLGHGVTARGGYRYSYAETTLRNSDGDGTSVRSADLTLNTAVVGFAFQRGQWIHASLDFEKNSPSGGWTRTDLMDYDQIKFDLRVSPWKKVSLNGRVAILRNNNYQADIDWNSHNKNWAVGVTCEPSERFNLSLDYSRSNIFSDLAILIPQTLSQSRSVYDERGHGLGGALGIVIYRGSRFEMGYRGVLNAGSYPLNYHQPFASLSIPLQNHLAVKTYWQYFGYNEKGVSLQDYRTHLLTISLAYSY